MHDRPNGLTSGFTTTDEACALLDEYEKNRLISQSIKKQLGNWGAFLTGNTEPVEVKKSAVKKIKDRILTATSFQDWVGTITEIETESLKEMHVDFATLLHAVRTLLVQYIQTAFSKEYKNTIDALYQQKETDDRLIKAERDLKRDPKLLLDARMKCLYQLSCLGDREAAIEAQDRGRVKANEGKAIITIRNKLSDTRLLDESVPLFFNGNYYKIYFELEIKQNAARMQDYSEFLEKNRTTRKSNILDLIHFPSASCSPSNARQNATVQQAPLFQSLTNTHTSITGNPYTTFYAQPDFLTQQTIQQSGQNQNQLSDNNSNNNDNSRTPPPLYMPGYPR